MSNTKHSGPASPERRDFLALSLSAAALAAVSSVPFAAHSSIHSPSIDHGTVTMSKVTTRDGVEIFYKDWGPKDAQPIMFHHGWPLSSDDWDNQALFFVSQGYRVIAHDRRGHGRSSQVSDGHDMDHYAADVAEVVDHLDLRNVVHIGHSTGGGEAARYVAKHGQKHGRVAMLVLIGAVPPIMVKTPANPGGLPIEVFDGFRKQLAANRAQFYLDVAGGPFYGFNRQGPLFRRASSRTGGDRVWPAVRRPTMTASRRSPRPISRTTFGR